MKKIIACALALTIMFTLSTAALAIESADIHDQIVDHMIVVNQQLGLNITDEVRDELNEVVSQAAENYQNIYGVSLRQAYIMLQSEVFSETPINPGPAVCATITVALPVATKGDIFFIDNSAAWNHVGMYTDETHIVESMPEDGVQYWKHNDPQAYQEVVVEASALDGVNDTSILRVSTTTANRNAAANWPGLNVPAGTPYDYDFLDNKQDYYFASNIGATISENDNFNCSELVWKAYNKAAGIDLDSNGGLGVYPNNIYESDWVVVTNQNWW